MSRKGLLLQSANVMQKKRVGMPRITLFQTGNELRIFFVAGESSGDTHGAHLVRALRAVRPGLECEGLGGVQMAAAGMKLRYNLAGRAIMGFAEVLRSLKFIRRLFHETMARLKETRPDCLVLIDYPGFNIRLAQRAKKLGIPVVYYISPQIWAWKKGRIHTLAACVEKMLVILPFEEALYRNVGVDCTYVGHPLLDHLPSVKRSGRFRGGKVVGLLPGSREQEIARIFPLLLDVAAGIAQMHPDARFVAPCVDDAREAQVKAIAGDFPVETVVGGAYDVLDAARFCLVASGTATLETCLFGVPMVIVYRVSPVSYWLARMLVDIEHIGIVNILADKRIVPEFVQQDACVQKVLPAALELMDDTPARAHMLEDLAAVKASLGGPGASARAAAEVLRILDTKTRRHEGR